MANPQIEGGYTRIANELLDALCRVNINGEARQVFDAILRKTYGYQKKSDVISISQIEKATGLPRRNVCRGIQRLKKMRLILTETKNKETRYWIQKDWEKWQTKSGDKAVENLWKEKKGSGESDTSDSVENVTPSPREGSVENDTNNIKKEIIKEVEDKNKNFEIVDNTNHDFKRKYSNNGFSSLGDILKTKTL